MRKYRGLGAGLLNLCSTSTAIVLLLLSHVASAADGNSAADIVVTFISGNVVVTHQGQQSSLRVGGKLGLPVSIRTGGDGTIELRQNRTTVTVAANSSLEIPVTGLTSGKIDRVMQSSGSVFYRVEPRETQKLRVETPYLVAVIKGTQFNVVVQPDNSTVALFEGMLQIAAPDDSDGVDLNAGEIAIRYGTDARIRVLRMNTGETLRADLAAPVAPTIQNAAATPVVNGLAGALPGANVANAIAATNSAGATQASINIPVNVSATGNSNSVPTNAGAIGSAASLTASLKGVGVSTSAALGGSAINVNTNVGATTNVGGLSASVGVGANANLGAGGVGLNAGVSVGAAGTAIGSNIGAAINVGNGAASVATGVGASVSAANSSIGVTTSVGLAAGGSVGNAPSVNLSANVSTAASVGSTAATITAAPSLNVGAGSLAANATAAVGIASPVGASAPTTVGASVGVTHESVSTTLSIGTVALGVSIPLDTGLLGNNQAVGSTTTSTTPAPALPVAPAPNPGSNNGGLLGRLRILNGRK